MSAGVDRAVVEQWLLGKEDEHCEFKEARNNFDSHELAEYCVALANEGGGRIVLGISDGLPRRVVGSHAHPDLESTKQAEVIYEYRLAETSIPYQHRREYRQGFLLYHDSLWSEINARNEVQQVRSGLFITEIQSFNEVVVREGLLNAICHRDYRRGESIFVRHSSRRLEVESPGGLPPGVTADTILRRQNPRNRRIADTFQKCGLVERSGQGADKMFRLMLEEGKRRPDFSESDEHRVLLRLDSDIQDPRFVQFLNKVGERTRALWGVEDLIVLDSIRAGEVRAADERVRRLMDQGVVELVGRGRGTRYLLSKRFYAFAGQRGQYTRSRGLDRETNKALLLNHLKHHVRGTIEEFEGYCPR